MVKHKGVTKYYENDCRCLQNILRNCYRTSIKSFGSLSIDNGTAYPHLETLQWIKVHFLPPNTTSHTQPINSGIIGALKAKYRSLGILKPISVSEKKERILIISILSAMVILKNPWNAVSNKTFTNYFIKAGISEKEKERVMNDEDDPFGLDDIEEDSIQTLEADLAYLKKTFGNQVDLNITVDEYVNFDVEVSNTHGELIKAAEEDSDDEQNENDDG